MSFVQKEKLQELREKFLKGRLEDEDFFNRPDIHTWLAEQRRADVPHLGNRGFGVASNERDGWWKYLSLIHKSGIRAPFFNKERTVFSVLKEMGFPAVSSDNPYIKKHISFYESIPWHLSVLMGSYTNAILTSSSILFFDDKEKHVLVATPGMTKGGTYHTSFLSQDAAESLVLTWLSHGGMNGSMYNFEKKELAREYLCDWLEKCIAEVEKVAGDDFDAAVAVGCGVTGKILHADWVLMFLEGSDYPYRDGSIYRHEVFTDMKILRSENLLRVNEVIPLLPGDTLQERIVATVEHSELVMVGLRCSSQVFFTFLNDEGVEQRCFVALQNESDPLPSGGVLV